MYLVLITIILILIIFYLSPEVRSESIKIKPIDTNSIWNNLSMGEKVQSIINTYFNTDVTIDIDNQKKQDDNYIQSLVYDDKDCIDNYKDCQEWADNNECNINPEYMLYNCAKSCKACKLTDDNKDNLIKIYNKREADRCIYHNGNDYPGPFKYLNKIYLYSDTANL